MLRLGIIGLSPGNGHPYSWSAIFNGYNPKVMKSCGFPMIISYLEKRVFPDDQICDARVTHVWAQESDVAAHIARATNIDSVVANWTDLIGQVDAVLLARDDAGHHSEFALPFLNAGVPIYVDKPLALTVRDARNMFDAQQYPGQLFSCSALRYAQEFHLSDKDHEAIGPIIRIHATAPKDWDKYAVHVIEPSLILVPQRGHVMAVQAWRQIDSTTLNVAFESGFELQVSTTGRAMAPLGLRVMGERGWMDLSFHDSFAAFRRALQVFVDGVRTRQQSIDPEFVMEVVKLIEAGRQI